MGEPDQMSFLEHLEELRWKLVKAIVAILVCAIAAFIFKGFVFDTIILAPKNPEFLTYRVFCKASMALGLDDAFCFTRSFQLQNISMSGQFSSHILVSVVAGLIVSFPVVFYQIWSFVLPGLRDTERQVANGVVFFTTLLFLMGILFGYYLIAPLSVQFLGNYRVSEQVDNIITLSSFISTVTTTTLASGIVFQLPIVVYFLAKVGVVTPQLLRAYRKHAIVAVLVLSAIITPPDITSQVLVTLPLIVLYEISIHIARVVVKKSREESTAVE